MSGYNSYEKFVWQTHEDFQEETDTTTYEWDYELDDVIRVENFVPRTSFLEAGDVSICIPDDELDLDDPTKCMGCENDGVDIVCNGGCCFVCLDCRSSMEERYAMKNIDSTTKFTPVITNNGCKIHFDIQTY